MAVAADSKGRWGYAFGERTSARAQAEALRGCGALGCDIQETARARCLAYVESRAGGYSVPCWPRSHAERGSLHGRARMRAGSAGSNVPSCEGDLRVTDRDIGPGSAPAPHIATYRHDGPNLAAATPQPGAMPGPAVRNAYMPRSDGCDIGPLITSACWGAASGAGIRFSKLLPQFERTCRVSWRTARTDVAACAH